MKSRQYLGKVFQDRHILDEKLIFFIKLDFHLYLRYIYSLQYKYAWNNNNNYKFLNYYFCIRNRHINILNT